jgi:hypothetical protein
MRSPLTKLGAAVILLLSSFGGFSRPEAAVVNAPALAHGASVDTTAVTDFIIFGIGCATGLLLLWLIIIGIDGGDFRR